VGLPHPHWGEAVTAFVCSSPGVGLTESMILDHCRKNLGRFEVPKKVVFLEQFPMTATGKVKKHLLRATYENLYDG
jgi:long-chain acyl-CoA synthetase